MTSPRATAASTPVAGCFLGFDVGARYLGVAVGDTLTRSARPLKTLLSQTGGPDWAGIDALLTEWRPLALIVGLPLTLDGAEQANSRRARGFAAALAKRSGKPVHLADERYSSREASKRFAAQRQAGTRRRHHAAALDAMAAAIILENWFHSPHD
ncbi:MAG TPA: Holliday junction resolvase RuvX [Rhodanobacteraceae bacterium]|nr:Holliday junction resolvase RuvX [Rhodanobacteraceae bacterium]